MRNDVCPNCGEIMEWNENEFKCACGARKKVRPANKEKPAKAG